MTRVVSLLTDFGLKDEYVGVMKGVILSHCPTVQIVDITHGIPPQDILLAARTIKLSYPFFPQSTIHLVVVDPGVGTDRSILLIEAADQLFIAPDNGVLSPILSSNRLQRCYLLKKPAGLAVSNTFHGRDLMAPLAGKLAAGMDIADAGSEIDADACLHLDLQKAVVTADTVTGEVVSSDNFGNMATSISADDLTGFGSDVTVTVAEATIFGLNTTYADTSENKLLALIDSRGYLEIAENCGNATNTLGCRVGAKVTVRRAHLLE